ncbi:MAG: cytochrome c1 [Candidatus Fonsibacter sp.]|nr:cytochrome c1 [Candidatus Fonsibacter sp.]
MSFVLKFSLFFLFFTLTISNFSSAEKQEKLLRQSWSFDGFFGKFDRASLQRGYQVYTEVCASCHSMNLLSYRNLSEVGGPGFSEDEVKAISSKIEVLDGPNESGEMFKRSGKASDKFASPFPNEKAARAANGGAYPPDMSVLVKARAGGADYIYSILMGYEDKPPKGIKLEDGVYYNKYMSGNKIKMSKPLNNDSVTYSDGTASTQEQLAKDVVTFLTWASEPHLEARKRIGFKTVIYLLILTALVYLVKKKIWLRIEPKV